jgi:hypothetical protein
MGNNFKKPNFFIIGAPKCGTTSLFNYLKTHPDIFLASIKEPGYFATDRFRRVFDEESYFKLFERAKKYKVVGEASTKYLYSEVAVKNILEFNPDSKFIVMIRNPADMFESLHHQNLIDLEEDLIDPKKAWHKQIDRQNGVGIPSSCRHPSLLQYGKVCKLGEQLQKLYSIVGCKNNIKIIEFKEFIEETQKTYNEILDFLGVKSDNRGKFPVFNSRSELKVKFIKKLFKAIPQEGILKKISSSLKKKLGISYWPFSKRINSWNRKKVSKRILDEDFKDYLRGYFQEDQKLLDNIVNQNR